MASLGTGFKCDATSVTPATSGKKTTVSSCNTPPTEGSVIVSEAELHTFYHQILEPMGVCPANVDAIAKHLIEANLLGFDSHGLQQILGYTDSLQNGRIQKAASPELAQSTFDAVLRVEGNGAPGQRVASFAMEHALARARTTGTCLVAATNSNHFGMAGYYTRLAAESGFVSFGTSDTNVVDLAAQNTDRPIVGNNPISCAFPVGKDEPFVLDMAAGPVSGGKIAHAGYQKIELAEPWGIDQQGKASTHPQDICAVQAADHKQLAIALAADCLCGPLLGTVAALFKRKGVHDAQNGTGHLFFVIHPECLGPENLFKTRVAELLHALAPHGPYPGKREALTKACRRKNGIPVPIRLVEALWQRYGEEATLVLNRAKANAGQSSR